MNGDRKTFKVLKKSRFAGNEYCDSRCLGVRMMRRTAGLVLHYSSQLQLSHEHLCFLSVTNVQVTSRY